MSSWALTSFVKNYEEQPSGVGLGSIIETENAANYQHDELSIDECTGLTSKLKREERKMQLLEEVSRRGGVVEAKKRKRFSINEVPKQGASGKGNEPLH